MAELTWKRGRYRGVRLLGRGSMGEVWLARDGELDRLVAVKRLRAGGGPVDAGDVERLLREARLAGRIHHPNVVSVFDLGRDGDEPFIVMEFVEGESLAQRLRRDGPLEPPVAARVVGQVAAGLAAAHAKGIVHRDVKPSNVLITDEGVVKLADLGIARGVGDSALTETGQLVGTVSYMAPEVARGGAFSAASDVWSLGATFYAALEGHPPFDPPTGELTTAAMLLRLTTEPVPPPVHSSPLTAALMQMLDTDPGRRPTAADINHTLTEPASGIRARDPGRGHRNRGRVPIVLALVGAFGAALVAAEVDDRSTASLHQTAAARRTATSQTTRSAAELLRPAPPVTRVVSTVPLALNPTGMAIAPDGKYLYISNYPQGTSNDGSLTILDMATRQVIKQVPLKGLTVNIAVTPDGKQAWVGAYPPNGGVGRIYVIDTRTATLIRSLPVGQTPAGIAFASTGTNAYVANLAGFVTVVDTRSPSVVKRISFVGGNLALALAPSRKRLYLTKEVDAPGSPSGGFVSVLDLSAGSLLQTVPVGELPFGVAALPNGLDVYAACADGVYVLDTRTGTVRRVIRTGGRAEHIAVSPDGRYAYVTGGDIQGSYITVIDTSSETVVRTIALEGPASGVAIAPGGTMLYAATGGSSHPGTLAVLAQ